ncbi:2-succinyl-6-hydroxy-2,4-cyclohexadiene-1-carboxylate synthase [Cedecea neteri]|uniref:2-succinyl-6-hydroxy-2,4-cyclohexadiene-1-carboxy late synthase n=1 Tax=Cedecea neteri TaxID=158822 RepID=A0A2X3IF78_9ENTR|nr:2-succinyl-6-hydroxy-2,4-cyclohexadiene-1-carboxylate synthase [Cedecea neteri]
MILHAVPHLGRRSTLPWIVWLHGFLGSRQEWEAFEPHFPDWPQLRIDLPGHGGSADVPVQNFAEVDSALRNTLKHHGIDNYWLVGYSPRWASRDVSRLPARTERSAWASR